MRPASPEAYKLFHEGVKSLAQVEANGIHIDVDYLQATIESVDERIREMQAGLRKDEVYKKWRRAYGGKLNLGSRPQLAKVLYDVMGFECNHFTDTGKPSTSEAAVELIAIEVPFVKDLLRVEKFKKLRSTYLGGLLREVQDGVLHPFFNLHKVATYRSSSDSPNFQNIPIRDAEIAELIRTAFISRPGHQLVEIDFSGVEVRVAACYNNDPNLIAEIMDPERDMHRDMAAACYKLKPKDVTKLMRYCGKNKFVFPQFYGSYFAQCAPNLWDGIDQFSFEHNGKCLKKHLKKKGIRELGECNGKPQPGTFEHHIKSVEKLFWDKRFKVYRDWKKAWYRKYLKTGGFYTKTGFVCQGIMGRNDVSNYPIQGSAFHCLLKCLIEIQRRMNKRKMKSLLVGQIHDSIIGDIHASELEDFIELAIKVMTKWLPKTWSNWITVPIDVDVEVCPVGGNWFQKKEIEK